MSEVYIARYSAWTPCIRTTEEWNEWALDKRDMCSSSESPDLAFADPMFRRRLSQISKMTIQVVHDLLPLEEDTKMIFLSFRGELSSQYKISNMIVDDNAIMPAAFSLSVFNTPIALASMAFGLKGGYSAIYPGKNSFKTGIITAQAALRSGTKDELVFVYADEKIPPEYKDISSDNPAPFAFGLLLTTKPGSGFIPLSSLINGDDCPANFLKKLFLYKG